VINVRTRLKELITRESLLLSVLVLMGAAGWLFIEIQDEVREGDMLNFDERILLLFRVPDAPERLRGPDGLEYVVRDLTALGGTAVLTLLVLGVAGFFLLRRQFQPLVLMLTTVIGGTLLMAALKNFYARPRPELIPRLMDEHSHSFPSGHSTMATVVYLTLAVMVAAFQEQRRMRVYIVGFGALLAGLIGLTRVMLGVHYPSDVAAGWTLGVVWALLGWLVAQWLKRRRPGLEASADPEVDYQ